MLSQKECVLIGYIYIDSYQEAFDFSCEGILYTEVLDLGFHHTSQLGRHYRPDQVGDETHNVRGGLSGSPLG